MGKTRKPLDVRLRQFTSPPNEAGCMLFIGSLSKWGYGQIYDNGRTRSAHRVSYELAYSVSVLPQYVVMHVCDVPACVNPAHLRVGTHKQNMIDCYAKGRIGTNALTAGSIANIFAVGCVNARTYTTKEATMLGYDVWVPSLGVCSFAFDWRYDCGTAVVPLVYTNLREYSVVRSAPNGVTPLVTDLDDVVYRAGVEHFDFKGSRERIIADTRAALEAIAKIKLCAILDGETTKPTSLQTDLPFARTEELH